MKDILGQDIVVGSMVLWGGGKTQYAGFAGGPKQVIRLTAKRVVLAIRKHSWAVDWETVTIDPTDVVVVDKLIPVKAG